MDQNAYRMGAKEGRPAKYETPQDLEAQILAYFDQCRVNITKATVTGLTLYLGFESRSSLDDYANRSTEFSYMIKRAKLAVENSYELSGSTFDIFALKNMGWKDKTETDLNVAGSLTWNEQRTYEAPGGGTIETK